MCMVYIKTFNLSEMYIYFLFPLVEQN